MSKKIKKQPEEQAGQLPVYGNPEYSDKDDIYSREKKESFEDSDEAPMDHGKKIKKPLTGEDLDVPGAELDDPDEDIGEEDEENNYYSLGGDIHETQEENKGE